MRAFSRLCYGFRAWRVPSECMAAAVPGRRRTAVESQTTTRLFTRVFEVGGRGSFLQFLRERAIERRDTLCQCSKLPASSSGPSRHRLGVRPCLHRRHCATVSVVVFRCGLLSLHSRQPATPLGNSAPLWRGFFVRASSCAVQPTLRPGVVKVGLLTFLPPGETASPRKHEDLRTNLAPLPGGAFLRCALCNRLWYGVGGFAALWASPVGN